MAENWIEKAGLEKLALDTANKLHFNRMSDENPSIILKAFKKIAKLTSNLDLSITWVENRAEWGDFTLEIEEPIHGNKFWQWSVRLAVGGRMGTAKSKEDCQAACVDALKRIVTGGK